MDLDLPPVQEQMKIFLYAKVGRDEVERNRGMFAVLNSPLLDFEFVAGMKLYLPGTSTWVKSVDRDAFHLIECFHYSASNPQRSCAIIEIPIDLSE